jgi:hypothetical protein
MGDDIRTLAAMAPKVRFNFWMDPAQREGLQFVKERDGVPESEQVRRAVEAWLTAKGVKAERKRVQPRPRS